MPRTSRPFLNLPVGLLSLVVLLASSHVLYVKAENPPPPTPEPTVPSSPTAPVGEAPTRPAAPAVPREAPTPPSAPASPAAPPPLDCAITLTYPNAPHAHNRETDLVVTAIVGCGVEAEYEWEVEYAGTEDAIGADTKNITIPAEELPEDEDYTELEVRFIMETEDGRFTKTISVPLGSPPELSNGGTFNDAFRITSGTPLPFNGRFNATTSSSQIDGADQFYIGYQSEGDIKMLTEWAEWRSTTIENIPVPLADSQIAQLQANNTVTTGSVIIVLVVKNDEELQTVFSRQVSVQGTTSIRAESAAQTALDHGNVNLAAAIIAGLNAESAEELRTDIIEAIATKAAAIDDAGARTSLAIALKQVTAPADGVLPNNLIEPVLNAMRQILNGPLSGAAAQSALDIVRALLRAIAGESAEANKARILAEAPAAYQSLLNLLDTLVISTSALSSTARIYGSGCEDTNAPTLETCDVFVESRYTDRANYNALNGRVSGLPEAQGISSSIQNQDAVFLSYVSVDANRFDTVVASGVTAISSVIGGVARGQVHRTQTRTVDGAQVVQAGSAITISSASPGVLVIVPTESGQSLANILCVRRTVSGTSWSTTSLTTIANNARCRTTSLNNNFIGLGFTGSTPSAPVATPTVPTIPTSPVSPATPATPDNVNGFFGIGLGGSAYAAGALDADDKPGDNKGIRVGVGAGIGVGGAILVGILLAALFLAAKAGSKAKRATRSRGGMMYEGQVYETPTVALAASGLAPQAPIVLV